MTVLKIFPCNHLGIVKKKKNNPSRLPVTLHGNNEVGA